MRLNSCETRFPDHCVLRRRPSKKIYTFMANYQGEAFCHSPMLCFRAQRSFFLDPFNAGQAIKLRRVDPSPLLSKIAQREFAIVQLAAIELSTLDAGYSFGDGLELEFRW